MNQKKIPSLTVLRAFEAVARLQTVVAASKELNLSKRAIYYQIRGIEIIMGTPLFERRSAEWRLTKKGQELYSGVTEAFNQLEFMLEKLFTVEGTKSLRISVLPSFAAQWLVKRLPDFTTSHPNVEIQMDSTNLLSHLDRESIDLGIRYGFGQYEGLVSEALLPEALAPVCHPDFMNGKLSKTMLQTPKDLTQVRLLHDRSPSRGMLYWRDWFEHLKIGQIADDRGPQFTDSHLTIQAALNREGVMLGRRILVRELLEQKLLVAPFDLWLPERAKYYIVYSNQRQLRPIAKTFISWLKRQAEEFMTGDPILERAFKNDNRKLLSAE